jgi:phosphoglycolate phosphatase
MVRLIAFDLDGTLVDSRQDLADAANELLGSYGAASIDQASVVRMVGEGARILVQRVLDAGRVDVPIEEALDRFLELYDRRLAHHTRPYPGVPALLAALDGRHALAVLTNKPQRASERLIAHFGWTRCFFAVVGGDTSYGRKPEPAALHALRAQSGASAAETLLVGDSWVDVETARRAGVRVCFAGYGFGDPPVDGFRDGEHRIAEPLDLLALLRRKQEEGRTTQESTR